MKHLHNCALVHILHEEAGSLHPFTWDPQLAQLWPVLLLEKVGVAVFNKIKLLQTSQIPFCSIHAFTILTE